MAEGSGRMSAECRFEWCDDITPEHDFHHGKLVTAKSGESEVDLWVMLDLYPGDQELKYSFEMDWSIASGEGQTEFADLRSILDQMEAAVRDAEAKYQQELTQ